MDRFLNKSFLMSSAVLAGALVSCGEGLTKLTDAQKEEVRQVLGSAAGPIRQGQLRTAGRNLQSELNADTAVTVASDDGAYLPQALEDSFEKNCQTNSNMDKLLQSAQSEAHGGNLNGNLKFDFAVANKGKLVCPFTLDMGIVVNATQEQLSQRVDANVTIKYAVQNEELKKVHDVYGYDLTGKMTAGMNVAKDQKSATVDIDMSIEGTLKSQKHADIALAFSVKGSGEATKMGVSSALRANLLSGQYFEAVREEKLSAEQSGVKRTMDLTTKLRLELSDFIAEIRAEVSGDLANKNNHVKYFINDQESTEAEVQKLLSKFFEVGKDAVPSANKSDPTVNVPSEPTLPPGMPVAPSRR